MLFARNERTTKLACDVNVKQSVDCDPSTQKFCVWVIPMVRARERATTTTKQRIDTSGFGLWRIKERASSTLVFVEPLVVRIKSVSRSNGLHRVKRIADDFDEQCPPQCHSIKLRMSFAFKRDRPKLTWRLLLELYTFF